MKALSDSDIVWLWECGGNLHPIDRALHLLMLAFPERTLEELAGLSIGRRNSDLLAVRTRTLGSRLDCFTHCENCGTQLNFELDPTMMARERSPVEVDQGYTLENDGLTVRFRLPDSRDLAAIAHLDTLSEARGRLLERCITEVHKDGLERSPADLSEEILAVVSERMDDLDPLAAMEINLTCSECNHEWSVMLDIVSYLWTELADRARRLLNEVHCLARAYGWRESDILAMSSTRRLAYMEMLQ